MEAENDGPMGETMTDEERKELVEHLRAGRPNQFERKATDEIERLAALVQSDTEPGPDSILHKLGECPAQSDAEPVAWRWRNKGTSAWQYVEPDVGLPNPMPTRFLEVEPLYTAPHRPDASALKEKADLFDNAVEAGRNAGWDMGIYTPKTLIETLNSELVRLYAIVERAK